MRTILIGLLCIGAVGCQSAAEQQPAKPDPLPIIQVQVDPELTRQEVLRCVPVGTPIADAKRIMKHNGFECAFLPDGNLFCAFQRARTFWIGDRWQVTMQSENGTVADVSVSHALVGP